MARTRGFEESQIIAAVRDRFQETGYAATSLDDIMRASGLGKGSIYGAFGNKRALFLRAFDTYCSDVVEDLSDALRGPDESAFLRLVAALRSSAVYTDDAIGRACFLARTTAELAAQDDAIASRARATFAAFAAILATSVKQAQAAGHIDRAKDPVAVGHFLLSVLRGNEALSEAHVDSAVLRDVVELTIGSLAAVESGDTEYSPPLSRRP